MFRVDRLAGIAIVLILLFAVWVSGSINYNQGYRDACDERTADILDCSPDDRTAIKPPNANPKSQRNEWRQEQDLVAQRIMAVFTIVIAVFTGIGIIYIARTLNATGETLVEARSATKAAEDAVKTHQRLGEIELRAYMVLDGFSLTEESNPPGFLFRIQFKNAGSTTAKHFKSLLMVEFAKPGYEPKIFFEAKLGEGAGTVVPPNIGTFQSVFMKPEQRAYIEAVNRGELVMGVGSVASYNDVFGRRRFVCVKCKIVKLCDPTQPDIIRLQMCARGNASN